MTAMAQELQLYDRRSMSKAMSKSTDWKYYLKHAFIAAILYTIPVFFLLSRPRYPQVWLLYLGNAIFMVSLAVFLFIFNSHKDRQSMTMVRAGATVAILGIIISVLLSLILLVSLDPGLLGSGSPERTLTDAPASTIQDKAHGLIFMTFGSAIIGNFATGLFICILFPFTLKAYKTKKTPPGQSQA
jgi:SNF family Na+-dependent transporter